MGKSVPFVQEAGCLGGSSGSVRNISPPTEVQTAEVKPVVNRSTGYVVEARYCSSTTKHMYIILPDIKDWPGENESQLKTKYAPFFFSRIHLTDLKG